ncbi:hypothetical protein C1H46_009337 [Malus baccata]|uniref:Uncharacterized protein n=1 Tax=Malus baccata TaxID=106549 RepID=A0A540N1Z2_MALBA|nr:hypothetical protein C1H46_009337 [Malus baccata]
MIHDFFLPGQLENLLELHGGRTSPPLCSSSKTRELSNGVAAMQWSIAGGRGPFTPSQWMELEHQWDDSPTPLILSRTCSL